MNEEKKTIESFKRYIIFQESTLDDYYKMDEEYYKDKIEQLELSIKLLKTVLNLLEKKDTLIHTMQSEFERLEDLEDNADMLKMELEKKDIDIIEANRQLSVELQKKDKIINLIAKELVKAHEWFYSEFDNYTKEDFIKYFEKKVEEDKEYESND